MEHETDDAFAELGLASDATEAEVKVAWRRLVSQWHPDRNASAAAVAKMQRINRAFKAIRQAGFAATGRRAASGDSSGKPRKPADAAHAQAGASADRSAKAEQRTANGFAQGGAGSSGASGRPRRTISRRLKLTLEEAAAGATKVVRGKLTAGCKDCDGAGYRVLGGHCAECQGSGAIRQRAWFGWIGTQSECEACHGGGIARKKCASCAGTGSESLEYKFRVRIPLGVRDGDKLHVDGRSQQSGAVPVDLDIRVEVLDHSLFRLEADGTIHCDVPVDGFAWIANRTVEVPTLAGLRTVRLDRDRLSYRLAGQGFPVERRGLAGDHLITITPIFPSALNTDQQILLDQLIATTAGSGADERLKRWNDVLRECESGAMERV